MSVPVRAKFCITCGALWNHPYLEQRKKSPLEPWTWHGHESSDLVVREELLKSMAMLVRRLHKKCDSSQKCACENIEDALERGELPT